VLTATEECVFLSAMLFWTHTQTHTHKHTHTHSHSHTQLASKVTNINTLAKL